MYSVKLVHHPNLVERQRHSRAIQFARQLKRANRVSIQPYISCANDCAHCSSRPIEKDVIGFVLYQSRSCTVRRASSRARTALEDAVARLCNRGRDRKSTRLNSSHLVISYAVFCLKKKKKK